MNRCLLLPVILSLILCVGCAEPVDSEGEPHESQADVFLMLEAVEAVVTLDGEGMIVAVELESESQGDEVFELLKGIPTLKQLALAGSAVTDAGLEQLKDIPALEYLILEDTRLSNAAVQKLRQDLPNCRIDYGDGEEG